MSDFYNYPEAVKNDVLEYIRNEIDFSEFDSLDALEERLNDALWIEDSVTGNGSGSYTFNTWRAEEYLAHNWDILAEALEEFGSDTDILRQGAESCDVTIRCYLLNPCISEALEEIVEEFEKAHEINESDLTFLYSDEQFGFDVYYSFDGGRGKLFYNNGYELIEFCNFISLSSNGLYETKNGEISASSIEGLAMAYMQSDFMEW